MKNEKAKNKKSKQVQNGVSRHRDGSEDKSKHTTPDSKISSSNNSKRRVFAGIRPTGHLHLGSYLGVIKGMVQLQNNLEFETIYMVADAHAVTTPYDRKTLDHCSKEVILGYLAAGLDPQKSIISRQSMIPEHFELMHYLSSVLTVSRMQHLPTYKDKLEQHKIASMALLNYPVLMAADILAYKGELVPVGLDQAPHLEVAREVARKMNSSYGTDFPEPKMHKTKCPYVPSLLGEGKMSKSVKGSFINITDDLHTIKQRLASVPTDSGKGENIPSQGSVANLFYFVEIFQGKDVRDNYEKSYLSEGVMYSDLKDNLAQAIYKQLVPLQQRYSELKDDVNDVIYEGAKKARMIASRTLHEVKDKMGFGS